MKVRTGSPRFAPRAPSDHVDTVAVPVAVVAPPAAHVLVRTEKDVPPEVGACQRDRKGESAWRVLPAAAAVRLCAWQAIAIRAADCPSARCIPAPVAPDEHARARDIPVAGAVRNP